MRSSRGTGCCGNSAARRRWPHPGAAPCRPRGRIRSGPRTSKASSRPGNGPLLLSADGHRSLQPLSSLACRGLPSDRDGRRQAGLSRLFRERLARRDSHRQRRAVRLHGDPRPHGVERVVDAARHRPAAHPPARRRRTASTSGCIASSSAKPRGRPPRRARPAAKLRYFRRRYNDERPHEALGRRSRPPRAGRRRRGPIPRRSLPRTIRRISKCAACAARAASSRARRARSTSRKRCGQDVALEEIDEGLWTVRYLSDRLGDAR